MDVVHHALIGGAGLIIGDSVGHELIGLSFLIGSVFPDLDVLFMFLGKRFYLKHHQSITHSLLLMILYAAIIALFISSLLGAPFSWEAFWGALTGLLVHILLDLLNTFRISLFLPLSRKRYSLDAVFFIDFIMWSLTLVFYLWYYFYGFSFSLFFYPITAFAYIFFKIVIHKRVTELLTPISAIPSSLNPFEFFILCKEGESYHGYLYNYATKEKRRRQLFGPVDDQIEELASRSAVFIDMSLILRKLHITNVLKQNGRITIEAHDIAVRNFGGKFGKTTLTFNNKGELLDEAANI